MADAVVRQKYDRWNPVPKEIEDAVIAFYLEGNSALQCREKYGVSTEKVLKRRGIKMRPRGEHARKLDQSFYPEICRLYSSGISTPKLENKFGICRTRLYEILDLGGIKRRTGKDYRPQSSGREKEIIALYQTGLSAADTGKKFGVCEATVLYVLRNNEIALRPPGISAGTIARGIKGGVSRDPQYMRQKNNEYRNNRKKNDPLFKLVHTLRSRVHTIFRRKRGEFTKNVKTCELLGADWLIVFSHIESQFKEGMTWKNHGYGRDKWHVDHIVALASAKTQEELIKLFHYTNLQPLWQQENQRKGCR